MGEVTVHSVSPRRDRVEVIVGNVIIPFYRRGGRVIWDRSWGDRRKLDGRVHDRSELDVPKLRFTEALRIAYAVLAPR